MSVQDRDRTMRMAAPEKLERPRPVASESAEPADGRLGLILDSIADGFAVIDREWRITLLNRRGREIAALDDDIPADLVGCQLWQTFPDLVGSPLEAAYRRAFDTQEPTELEFYFARLTRWLHIRVFPSPKFLSVFFQDVTTRRQAESVLQAERAILAAVASRTSLAEVLESIVREVESRSMDGMLCSVLLLEGRRLRHGAAPSLAAEYNAAIDGLEIGPGVGSCGTAAHEGRPVHVTDIANDPLWASFKGLAAQHSLAACCSYPIRSSGGEVLGTIAMYYRRPHRPTGADERLVRVACDMAAIAIERNRAEEAQRRAEEFSRGIVDSSQDCIKTMTLDGRLSWVSESGCRALRITDPAQVAGLSWLDFWKGDDARLANEAMRAAIDKGRGSFVGYYPVAGEDRWWNVLITPMRGAGGSIESLLVVSRDVTERVLDQRRLEESERQLRLLANTIPQLAWMSDAEGDISWYNERWYEYTGTTPEEMRGWGWQSVHDPELLPKVIERWRESLASGAPFEMEFPLRGADGKMRWFLTRVNPLRDAEGKVVRWFGTNTDIDDVRRMRQALEEETRMLEILNRTGMALASHTGLGDLLQAVTDAATTLSSARFGAFFYNTVDEEGKAYQLYTLSGAPREAFEKFGHPRATPVFAPTFNGDGIIRLDDVKKDPRYGRMSPHHGMPPGHLPVCSYLAVPVKSRSGEVIGGLFFGHPEPGVFTERTERLVEGIASQAAVAIDNARLYEAAQKAAREREEILESERFARSEAERASHTKDEFLATLSHELRTPLSSILGWAHLMRSRPPSADELSKGLELIERNARVQVRMIEDLLDMSRITSGKLRLDVQPLFPVSFVQAALETVRPMAEAREVRLETTLDPSAGPVSGDPSRLQQVMWNLLSNAIKFTPKGGKVQVCLERVESHIEISVADTGAGIDPQFLGHIFERFRQADASTTRRFGGLGLGLSIVKSLVELHGGTVKAESAGVGQGATFTVELPLSIVHRSPRRREHPRNEPVEASPTDFSSVDLSGLHVLVVDDQPDACQLVSRVISECGARVSVATAAEDALHVVGIDAPDVILSDIGMPGMDGYELMRRIRALEPSEGPKIPAIAMTAFARSEDRTRALRSGFQVHLTKPIEPSELIATVASVAGRIGSSRA
jgi:PAS domain S-box-containing protein